MSVRPASLVDAAKYLAAKMAIKPKNFGIRNGKSDRGFHAGKSDIYGPDGQGDKDYSVKHPRNAAGLSEASAGLDIRWGKRKQLRALTAYLVEQGKSGNLLFEVIGPDENGKACYWGVLTNWQPKPKWASADHSWHIHLGFFRDTEHADRVALFYGFFELAEPEVPAPQPVPEPDPDPAPDTGDEPDLADFLAALKDLIEQYEAA